MGRREDDIRGQPKASSNDNGDDWKTSVRIGPINRIAGHIPIEIPIPAGKADRILGRPAPAIGIVVPRPEAHEPGVTVVEPAGKAEGLEAGFGVAGDGAPDVVVEPLGDGAGFDIDDESLAAEVVGEQAVGTLLLGRRVDLDEVGFRSRNGNFSTIRPSEHPPHGGPLANGGFREAVARIDAAPVLAWGAAFSKTVLVSVRRNDEFREPPFCLVERLNHA